MHGGAGQWCAVGHQKLPNGACSAVQAMCEHVQPPPTEGLLRPTQAGTVGTQEVTLKMRG